MIAGAMYQYSVRSLRNMNVRDGSTVAANSRVGCETEIRRSTSRSVFCTRTQMHCPVSCHVMS